MTQYFEVKKNNFEKILNKRNQKEICFLTH